MQNDENELLLQFLLRQWSEIKVLQSYLNSTDDEILSLAIFHELEQRLSNKGTSAFRVDDVEL